MTPKQYIFLKNFRIGAIILSTAFLVFGAGAVFTGYKPTLANYAIMVVIIINLISAILNEPIPPQE